jgi:hypothetical protein
VTLPRRTGRSAAWAVNDALLAATSADGGAITLPTLDGISPDSMGAVYALLVLIWTVSVLLRDLMIRIRSV